MSDPTYDPTYKLEEIMANPEWELAFTLSEILNDHAPIGWSKYIFAARCLRDQYDIAKSKPLLWAPQ